VSSFWIHGAMPLQLLLVLVLTFFLFVGGNYLLKKKYGKGVPRFGQAILIWLAAYFILGYIIVPPIPVSLLYTFMGLITLCSGCSSKHISVILASTNPNR